MKIQNKVSLNDFFSTILDDEKDLAKLLKEGVEEAYRKADYDLAIAWLMLLRIDLDNARELRIHFNFHKSWTGRTEGIIRAYNQTCYFRYDDKDEFEYFSFESLQHFKDQVNNNLTLLLVPMVQDLIKKLKDINNGSV
jgi:hypothetical protein